MYLPNIQLENMSCIDFLKQIHSNSIDLILIDPPYGVSRNTNFKNSKEKGKDTDRFRISMNFGKWDFDFNCLQQTILECYRILKITLLNEYMINAKFKQIRFIEWVKTNPVPINSKVNYLSNGREIAMIGVKNGKPTFHSQYHNGIYKYPICRDSGRFHPTQKPIELIKELITIHSNENDLVLDCFSCSGTTAIACMQTNRKFIGCEIEKEYYEKSVERIEKEYRKE